MSTTPLGFCSWKAYTWQSGRSEDLCKKIHSQRGIYHPVCSTLAGAKVGKRNPNQNEAS